MNNKAILKAMIAAIPVKQGDLPTGVVVDYSVNADRSGNFTYTAGCVDKRNKYWAVPCDELSCDSDLSAVTLVKPVWTSPYSPDMILQAMRETSAVTAGKFSYQRISRLSTVIDPSFKDLRYVAACEDAKGNIVVVKIDQVTIDGIEPEIIKGKEEKEDG